MRVFVTGATGFIGSAVVAELIDAGHDVTGLARSDEGAAAVQAAGAEGVIHTAYIHDFSPTADPAAFAEIDKNAINAFGEALAGTGKPLVVAAGLPSATPGVTATEETKAPDNPPYPRFTERTAVALADRGVRVSVVRMPPSVHGQGDPNFVLMAVGIARAKGFSAYVGEGANVWSAVHRFDAARLFRIALQQAPAGSLLNAVGEQGVPFKDIAAAIARHLDVPVKSIPADEAVAHFGMPFAIFAQIDAAASGRRTRERFGWQPTEPGLIADIDQGHYFAAATGH